jgi:hypothetical protein
MERDYRTIAGNLREVAISIACVVVGLLLLKVIFAAGLFLIAVSFFPDWFVIRLLARKVRKRNAP